MDPLSSHLTFDLGFPNIDMTPPATPDHQSLSPHHPVHAESSYGYLFDLNDALLIVQLCLNDKLPLVRRRLTLFEREAIRSGSIFAFIEANENPHIATPPRKSKDWQPMRRWTDGLAWSKSRVHGHYLVYKEVPEKRSARRNNAIRSEIDVFRTDNILSSSVKHDGLMKKTFSIIVDENVWHVINYYYEEDAENRNLPTPSAQFPDVKLDEKLLDPTRLKLRSSGPTRDSPSFSAPKSSRKIKRSRISDDEYSGQSDHDYTRLDAGLLSDFSDTPTSNKLTGGYITLRQVDPDSATVQIPLPSTLKDLKRVATKTFQLTTPSMILHGPHGEVCDANFPILMDGDHIDVEVEKRKKANMDPTAEAALALTRLSSAD